MAPTSLRLSLELKKRVEHLAAAEGKSLHAWLLETLESATDRAEKRREFVAAAQASRDKFERTGLGYRAEDFSRYMAEKAKGKNPKRPKLVNWHK
jgi:predicted transcriptional regulator